MNLDTTRVICGFVDAVMEAHAEEAERNRQLHGIGPRTHALLVDEAVPHDLKSEAISKLGQRGSLEDIEFLCAAFASPDGRLVDAAIEAAAALVDKASPYGCVLQSVEDKKPDLIKPGRLTREKLLEAEDNLRRAWPDRALLLEVTGTNNPDYRPIVRTVIDPVDNEETQLAVRFFSNVGTLEDIATLARVVKECTAPYSIALEAGGCAERVRGFTAAGAEALRAIMEGIVARSAGKTIRVSIPSPADPASINAILSEAKDALGSLEGSVEKKKDAVKRIAEVGSGISDIPLLADAFDSSNDGLVRAAIFAAAALLEKSTRGKGILVMDVEREHAAQRDVSLESLFRKDRLIPQWSLAGREACRRVIEDVIGKRTGWKIKVSVGGPDDPGQVAPGG